MENIYEFILELYGLIVIKNVVIIIFLENVIGFFNNG